MKRLLLLALPIALSSCAGVSRDAEPLAGTAWGFTAIDGKAPVERASRLAFEPDRVAANVGCNGMGGPWRIDNGRMIAGPLVQTEMFCEGRMDQEGAVSALLSAAPRIAIDGDILRLNSSGHSAVLVRED